MKKLFIIENDTDTLDLIGFVFEDAFNIIKFRELVSLHVIERFQPDVMIMDLKLESGFSDILCKQLKASEATSHIRVILCSAAADIATRAKEMCVDAWIEKPFDIDELKKKVVELVG